MNNQKIIKFEVEVIQTVEVELDLDKFTQKVRDNFEATIHKAPELEDHARFIGTHVAMGCITGRNEFVEGYGKLQEVGVKFSDIEQHSTVWRKLN